LHLSVPTQGVPSGAGVLTQPLAGLQVEAVWHAPEVHVTAAPPAHTPDWQESPCVHAFPSLHVVPFAAVGFEHAPVDGLHVPATWH
jgi:hypothetical protein